MFIHFTYVTIIPPNVEHNISSKPLLLTFNEPSGPTKIMIDV